MLDSEQIHKALNDLGYCLEKGKKEPSYAYEHCLGGEQYLYVKRKSEGGVEKEPLVLHPLISLKYKASISAVDGLVVSWGQPRKNTSYRKYPRFEGNKSAYGFAANVESEKALQQLVKILSGNENSIATMDKATAVEGHKAEMKTSQPLNQILYGPPGTGKTYHTAIKALEILDPENQALLRDNYQDIRKRYDELVEEGRIGFVTFHQSFCYEDFIEGIRAYPAEDGKTTQYVVEPGVFRKICRSASNRSSGAVDFGIRNQAKVWKISIGGTGLSDMRQHCFQNNEARIGWELAGDISDSERDSGQIEYFERLGPNDKSTLMSFAEEMQIGDMVLCISSANSIQAVGVITGHYQFESQCDAVVDDYRHLRKVDWLVHGVEVPFKDLNGDKGFTQKTVYELWRITPEVVLQRLQEQELLKKNVVPSGEAEPVVLIIDEINRGNISRIFGELITLIEPAKRAGESEALSATLTYSKDTFSVPGNLYIIGTMNTADRSLAELDIALRRRFEFKEMMPNASLLSDVSVNGISVEQLLRVINERIEALLDRDHTLGHSYFLPLREPGANTLKHLARIFEKQILPLLQEYFFEDWERIHWVLNDHQKPGPFQFVRRGGSTDLESLFGSVAGQISDRRWQINPEAFELEDSYKLTINKQATPVALQELADEEAS